MKKFLPFCFLLLFVTAAAQETITLKFVRPAKFQGSGMKIRIIIQDNEYILKNGSEISVNVKPTYTTSLRIDCKAMMGGQTVFYLKPKPGQNYEFEAGVKFSGLYIDLKSGEEGSGMQQADSLSMKLSGGKVGTGIINQSQSIRDEWIQRGGKIRYYSVMLTGIYFSLDMKDVGKMHGYGGGYSAYMNWLDLKIPDFKTGKSNWSSLNYGIGYDFVLYSFNFKTSTPPITMKMTMTTLNILVTGNIGYTWGIGKFKDEATWSGVALTLKYRPALNIAYTGTSIEMKSTNPLIPSSTTSSGDGNVKFNAGGVGFDIDFASYSATARKIAPKPKSKFSFFMLPPVGDSPLFISLSYGIVFYTR